MAPGTACGSGVATTGTACGTGAAQRERPRRGGTCRSWGAKAGPAGRTGQHLPVPVCSGWTHGRTSGGSRGGRPVRRPSAWGAGSWWPWPCVGCVVRDHAELRRHLYGPPVRADGGARLRSGGAVGRCSGRRRTSRPCGGPGVVGAVRADARPSDGDETWAADGGDRAREVRAGCSAGRRAPGASGCFSAFFH